MAGLIGTATATNNGLKSKNDFMLRANADDANDMVKNGLYYGIPANAASSDYSQYVVIGSSPHIIQFAFGLNGGSKHYRVSINGGNTWSGWTVL